MSRFVRIYDSLVRSPAWRSLHDTAARVLVELALAADWRRGPTHNIVCSAGNPLSRPARADLVRRSVGSLARIERELVASGLAVLIHQGTQTILQIVPWWPDVDDSQHAPQPAQCESPRVHAVSQPATVKPMAPRASTTPVESPRRLDNDQTLSPSPLAHQLTDEWFAAFGQERPTARARQLCLNIIDGHLAAGSTADDVRVGIALCVERGARGPQLLEYVLGEASAIVSKRAAHCAQAALRQAAMDQSTQQATQAYRDAQSALETLSQAERDELAEIARGRLPEGCSDRAIAGMMAYILSSRNGEAAGP